MREVTQRTENRRERDEGERGDDDVGNAFGYIRQTGTKLEGDLEYGEYPKGKVTDEILPDDCTTWFTSRVGKYSTRAIHYDFTMSERFCICSSVHHSRLPPTCRRSGSTIDKCPSDLVTFHVFPTRLGRGAPASDTALSATVVEQAYYPHWPVIQDGYIRHTRGAC